jgi:DNA replication protein DnaC
MPSEQRDPNVNTPTRTPPPCSPTSPANDQVAWPSGWTPERIVEQERLLAQYEAEKKREGELRHRAMLVACGVSKRHGLAIPAMRKISNGPWFEAFCKLCDYVDGGCLVALLGPRGTGKTQMASLLIDQKLMALRPGSLRPRILTLSEIFLEVRDSYRSDAELSEKKLLHRYATHSLLVIDEAHERGGTEFEDRKLIGIINKRYDLMLPTVLISNEKREAFANSIGTSAASRMSETNCGKIIECNWSSFRQHLPKEVQEARANAANEEWSSRPAGLTKIVA